MTEYTPDLSGFLSLALQFVLPLLVGLVTKRSTAGAVKAVLLLALTAVTQFVTTWQEAVGAGVDFNYRLIAWNVVLGFVMSTAVHYGLWRPTGLTDAAQDSGVHDGPG